MRLGDGDLLVHDGFLGERAALACAQAAGDLEGSGRLSPAGIGRDHRHRPDLRGDHTAWLSERDLPPALGALWQAFEGLGATMNRAAWLGLRGFDLQLACYAAGTRYVPHLDTVSGGRERRLTAIYYLNPAWRSEDGGALVAETPRGRIEVMPDLDRLVLFLSDRVRHEVLAARIPRLAATAWYAGAEPVVRGWATRPAIGTAWPRSPTRIGRR